jgi:hypothetical protein
MTRASSEASPAATSGSDRAAAEPSKASTPNPQRPQQPDAQATREIGGPKGPEPTRYGDWERNGRCSDF